MGPRRLALLLSAGALLLGACGGDAGGSGGPYPAGVAFGPLVSLPTPTSVTIAWRTHASSVGAVEFGEDASYGATAGAAGSTTDHEVLLDGLSPATEYHYRIGGDGVPLGGDHVFRTPPADVSAPVRFVVLGDTGTGDETARQAIALTESQQPDFVLVAGDVAYDFGSSRQVLERFLEPFASLMEGVPVFPALGNHDALTGGGKPLLDAVTLPRNSSDGGESYYSFDWGPCHVAALDSNGDLSAGSAQVQWLDADLAASTARWRFVLFHHPVYSSSEHGSRPDLAASLGPVLEARAVDVVFTGHDHDYERTYPMVSDQPLSGGDPDYIDPPGPVFVVTGGGGRGLHPSGTSAFTAFSESAHHGTRLDIADGTLTLVAIRLDGIEMDRMTITKSP